MAERGKAGWFRYIKEAFLFKWNVLLFGGAAAAAVITGHADIAIPLIAAAEITYLAGLAGNDRFQAAIDARAHSEQALPLGRAQTNNAIAGDGQAKLLDVLRGLADERRSRFLRLRARCVEMQRIANAVRGETTDRSGAAVELRQPALDRLLWVFLRLLLSQQALERFLRTADGDGLKKGLLELRAKEVSAASADNPDERMLRSIRDSIATAELRVENFAKANSNAQFVGLEIDRIEGKISAITEMSISNQDPDALSAQVDAVADGISQTEATIRELQSITGMSADLEGAPSILGSDVDTRVLT